jgi:competence protein ComEC
VAAYEVISARSERRLRLADRRDPSLLGRFWNASTGMALTSLVAGLATAPFAIFHFQRMAPLSLIANLAAMPAIGVIVMPMVLLTVVLMPLGLEVWPLTVMSWGLDWMIVVAEWTAAWTGDVGGVRAVPALTLLLVVAGFLWLTLWRESWRLLGLVPMLAALPIASAASVPDILVDPDGRAVAVRQADGRYAIMGDGSRFLVDYWLRADADSREADSPDLATGTGCDPLGCIARLSDGSKVALVDDVTATLKRLRR